MKSARVLGAAVCAASLCLPQWAASQTVSSFTVVNADTGADIDTFPIGGTSASGEVSITATPRINIRANASAVKSVVFTDGSTKRTENTAPYAYKGNKGPVYYPWAPSAGTYVINAAPFAGSGGTGAAGAVATLELTVVSAPPPPAIASFTVVNADTGADIATFTSSGTVSVASTPNINVRANGSGVQSVVFTDSSTTSTDSALPHAYKGDVNGVYTKWAPSAGTYVINAKPFASSGGTGTAGPAATLTLTVTNTLPPSQGHLMIDPNSVHHFVYDRDNDGDGRRDPAFLAGAGGPEGFLYLSSTRKQQIIDRLLRSPVIASPVGGLYFHSTRAFGGDGGASETPFINNADPLSGLDPAKLASWRADLKKLDDAGVILWFTLFDDHSVPYGCRYNADYQKYATEIVNTFKDLKHLVWVTQEEYRWTDNSQSKCTLADNDQRQIGLASAIRAADPIHPIATHHMGGQAMAFPNDPNIRVFGQQTTNNTPEAMHDKAGKQGWGNWVYVMAEAHPWHKDLIDDELNNAAGRELMRRSNWATAMAGGYVMMYDAFESGDPTDAMFDDLRRLKSFMEGTQFNRMAPLFDDALAGAKIDGTKYVLSNPAEGLYILYGDVNTGKLGVRGAPAGTYSLAWFDPVTGVTVNQSGSMVSGGLASFAKPAGIGPEAVLYLRKQ